MIRFKIDQDSTEILDRITNIYNFKRDSITGRIALALSINKETFFDESEKSLPQNGREYSPTSNIFGNLINDTDNYILYKAMFDQHYRKELSENEFIKFYKLHLKHGLELWINEINKGDITKGDHISFLLQPIKKGLSTRIKQVYTSSSNEVADLNVIKEYEQPISFSLGTDENNNDINIEINDETQWSSRNIAITGQNGSGKSQLIFDILFQISKSSDCNLPFTFFDFKGTDSKESLESFLNSTKCNFLKVEHNVGFPFSPLSNIDFNNPNNILSFANDFQTFFPEIKQVQSASLVRSIQSFIFDNKRAPSLEELMLSILETNKDKDNTTTSVLQQIISSGIYDEKSKYAFFNQSTYISMPSDVSKQIKQFVTFNILKYMFNTLKKSGNSNIENNIKALKHIIVIDEAQNFLQKKTARPIIEDMLRELRSIGVIVILIAQETKDFVYPDFDFISQVKLPICADVNDKSTNKMIKFIGSVNSEIALEKEITQYSKVESDSNGNPIKKAIININNPKSIKMKQWWQTKKDEKL
jgi:DNA sulfur modification protein DndE